MGASQQHQFSVIIITAKKRKRPRTWGEREALPQALLGTAAHFGKGPCVPPACERPETVPSRPVAPGQGGAWSPGHSTSGPPGSGSCDPPSQPHHGPTTPRLTPGPAGGRLRPQGPCREFWEMCFPKSQEKAVEKQRTGSRHPVAGPAVRPRPSHVPPRWAPGPTCKSASCPQELRPSLCLRRALESRFPRRCYPGPGGAAFLAPRQVSGPQADPLSPRVPVASMQGA